MTLTPNTAPVVIVEWVDIARFDGWNDDESPQTIEAVCIGWLLEDSEQLVAIAGSYDYIGEKFADVHVFPKTPPSIRYLEVEDEQS